mgnify:CR=1 FL=1
MTAKPAPRYRIRRLRDGWLVEESITIDYVNVYWFVVNSFLTRKLAQDWIREQK